MIPSAKSSWCQKLLAVIEQRTTRQRYGHRNGDECCSAFPENAVSKKKQTADPETLANDSQHHGGFCYAKDCQRGLIGQREQGELICGPILEVQIAVGTSRQQRA